MKYLKLFQADLINGVNTMKDFELETKYLLSVENTLQQIVNKNNAQIQIYEADYKRDFVDYSDRFTAPEVKKFLSGELKQLSRSIDYLATENYRYSKVKYSPYFAKIQLVEDYNLRSLSFKLQGKK